MNKIMVIGSGGSGKSTFSTRLGKILQLPVYHLDAYYWHPGWIPTPNEEWDQFLKELVLRDEWIIDGNYGRTMDIRMEKADVIIFFDLSPWITTYRVLKRRIKYHGKTRPDLNEGCPEQLDWDFIKWVWNFRKTRTPGIMEKLRNHAGSKKVVIIKTPKEAKQLLSSFEKQNVRQTI